MFLSNPLLPGKIKKPDGIVYVKDNVIKILLAKKQQGFKTNATKCKLQNFIGI
jgi:hypothetical protein